jgi:AcrR family transcriptional regulator
MPNRERILDVALKLFNDAGTGPISTNHIAAAAEISPGNLYYHFRNKEQIVQTLFERLFETYERVFVLPERGPPGLADLRHLVRLNFDLLWEYRFAYRELAALLGRDEILRERWLEVRRRGYVGFRYLIAAFVTAGVIAVADDAVIDRLADLC